jgi:hypothetical protein
MASFFCRKRDENQSLKYSKSHNPKQPVDRCEDNRCRLMSAALLNGAVSLGMAARMERFAAWRF